MTVRASGYGRSPTSQARARSQVANDAASVCQEILRRRRLRATGHMSTGHRLFCKEFLCFNTSPCRPMPWLVHSWKTRRKTSFQSAGSWGGTRCLWLGSSAKARAKGVLCFVLAEISGKLWVFTGIFNLGILYSSFSSLLGLLNFSLRTRPPPPALS